MEEEAEAQGAKKPWGWWAQSWVLPHSCSFPLPPHRRQVTHTWTSLSLPFLFHLSCQPNFYLSPSAQNYNAASLLGPWVWESVLSFEDGLTHSE